MEDQKENFLEFLLMKSAKITSKDKEASLNFLEETFLLYRYNKVLCEVADNFVFRETNITLWGYLLYYQLFMAVVESRFWLSQSLIICRLTHIAQSSQNLRYQILISSVLLAR